MTDQLEQEPATAASVGVRLRAGREAAGLDLADVAARTRIPQRHLEALEEDRLDALPSVTYSVGFARAHARAVGLDEVAIAAAVRQQLEHAEDRARYVAFEPADPARVPPRTLAWIGVILAVALVGAYAVWRSAWLGGPAPSITTGVSDPVAPNQAATPRAAAAAAPAAPVGTVVLTATETVWLRINDAAGNRLFEKEMQPGERYEVPADATAPTIRTGRAQALQVTVGGRPVAPLGENTVSGIGVSAAALAARPPAPAPTPAR